MKLKHTITVTLEVECAPQVFKFAKAELDKSVQIIQSAVNRQSEHLRGKYPPLDQKNPCGCSGS